MKIKNYISIFLNTLKKTTSSEIIEKTCINLNDHLKRFTYIACAVNKNNIEILTSKDDIGGYYEEKLILPQKINISSKKSINLLCYLYKIIFSLTSKQLNLYLPENKTELDYILLASITTVKTITKIMHKNFPNIKNLNKILYPKINDNRPYFHLNSKQCILEICIKKLTHKKIKNKINLNKEETLWIYNLENTINISNKNIKKTIKTLYYNLCKIYKISNNIELNQLWGYLYYKEKKKTNTDLKKILTETKQTYNKIKTDIKFKIKKIIHKQNKQQHNLNSLFHYKKTVDKYKSGNKNTEQNNKNLDILKELDLDTTIRNNAKIKSIFSTNTINSINIAKLKNNIIYTKKITYKEWDFEIKKYKDNWCHLFLKKENTTTENNIHKKITDETIEKNKKDIKFIKEHFRLLANKKLWIKRQEHGENIDFDSIIDNYKYIKYHNFQKIYTFKKKINKDIALSILFDSSLSTDSYLNNEKIIDTLKKLTLILSSCINDLIKKFSISTFHSNTRHDCKYIIIKDFNDKWNKVKYNINSINPNGYTRIGPAIRHTTQKLKNIIAKQKIILLLSDGKPTDYDEYEGLYGINDIKHAIHEAKLEKIHIKSIIINDMPKTYFPSMFGLNNYILITHQKTMRKQLLKILTDTIKN